MVLLTPICPRLLALEAHIKWQSFGDAHAAHVDHVVQPPQQALVRRYGCHCVQRLRRDSHPHASLCESYQRRGSVSGTDARARATGTGARQQPHIISCNLTTPKTPRPQSPQGRIQTGNTGNGTMSSGSLPRASPGTSAASARRPTFTHLHPYKHGHVGARAPKHRVQRAGHSDSASGRLGDSCHSPVPPASCPGAAP